MPGTPEFKGQKLFTDMACNACHSVDGSLKLGPTIKSQYGKNIRHTNGSVVIIDDQYIGQLKGLKLELDLKSGSLKTDIKSLKKAARHAISPELAKRVDKIIVSEVFKISNDNKIYWADNPIAFIYSGKNYLNPKLDIFVDESIDLECKAKLKLDLEKKLQKLILSELSDLLNLSKGKFQNNYVSCIFQKCTI